MPRRRLGVALLIPSPWAHEVDGLRRACGDGQLGRVPAHCTLVPPVNVRADDLSSALGIVRSAAASLGRRRRSVALALGPPTTFHPDSPTLHLPVDDRAGTLADLRAGVFRGPLERTTTWPFVPHVTVADEIDEARARAAVAALADYRATVVVDRIHVLEQRHDDERGRRWVPIADAPFRPAAVVGRGGIEIELSASELVDPLGEELVGPTPEAPPGARSLVVTARRGGAVVGVLTGWTRGASSTIVDRRVADHDLDIGRHLDAAFAGHAADGQDDDDAREGTR